MNKLQKLTTGFLLAVGVFASVAVVLPQKVSAEGLSLWGDKYTQNSITYDALNAVGLGNKDPRVIATNVISVLLGFLGLIAVILIMVGGFKWMTAQGNDANVDKAKKLMTAGVTGLLIVLAAFGVSIYITNVLFKVTGGNPAVEPQGDYNP